MRFSDHESRAEGALRGLSEYDRQEHRQRLEAIPAIPRYPVKERLGEGGVAVVFRAWDAELNRPVALKVLKETSAISQAARLRFRREAQVMAGLSHPNLIMVHDAGDHEGRLYLVMELVEGLSLAHGAGGRPPSLHDRVRLLERVARGVSAAHDRGIVHRDLKPGNVLVTPSGEPKVADFGLAHLVDSDTELTKSGTALGTPLYMAPEQVEGRPKEISPRTDVYSLGVMLYETLAGRPPYVGETLMELYQKIVRDEPVPPRRLDPGVPAELEAITLKAMEKVPGRRYATAGAFADDLARFLGGEPVAARPPGTVQLWFRKTRRYRAFVPTTLLALALLVALAFLLGRRREPPFLAFLEQVEGDVNSVEGERKLPARQGQILSPGQGVETGAWPSSGVLGFEDGTRLEIGAETRLAGIHLDRGRRLSLRKGILRAAVAEDAKGGPLLVDTPHGEAKGSGVTVRIFVDPDPKRGTYLAVEAGRLNLKTPAGATAVLESGQCAVLAEGVDPIPRPLGVRLDLGDGVTMELLHVRPGTFTMGGTEVPRTSSQLDERPEREVTLTQGFYLGKYEVTRRQFAAFVRATGYTTDAEREGKSWGRRADGSWGAIPEMSWRAPSFPQTDEHPVTCISWNDGKAFCDWATKKSGREVRLPAEAEWEYACRAGTKAKWSFGETEALAALNAWTDANSGLRTQPVGQKNGNPWGFYDLHGNVWEWCRDETSPRPSEGVGDPAGPSLEGVRCLRGGGWTSPAIQCRSAVRLGHAPGTHHSGLGFRVAAP